jgi:hypothetical protein
MEANSPERAMARAQMQSRPVLEVVRRELRRLSPDVRIEIEQIRAVIVLGRGHDRDPTLFRLAME